MEIVLDPSQLPLRLKPHERWSESDFFRFCQKNQELRIERSASGTISMMSPVESGSSERNQEISGQLWLWNRQTGEGRTFESSAGFTLPDGSMLSPDSAWISRERWDSLPPAKQKKFAQICPDFIVEVRSPSDRLPTLRRKMALWMANGAQLAWLVDLKAHTIEVYRPGLEPQLLSEPSEVSGEGPVAGFLLTTEKVWS